MLLTSTESQISTSQADVQLEANEEIRDLMRKNMKWHLNMINNVFNKFNSMQDRTEKTEIAVLGRPFTQII